MLPATQPRSDSCQGSSGCVFTVTSSGSKIGSGICAFNRTFISLDFQNKGYHAESVLDEAFWPLFILFIYFCQSGTVGEIKWETAYSKQRLHPAR